MSARRRLVLDLDTGIDDALALAYALGSPEVELVGVVASYGNVTVETAARNTLALLEMLGHPEVPVFLGADRPLGATGPFSVPAGVVRIHGANGLGGCELPDPAHEPAPDAAGFLVNAARRYGDELLYVPTGPLTNLALALSREPGLADALARVTFMGGALAVPGNVSPFAEANIANDPEAADAVLRSGLRTRMIGLDVTHQAVLRRRDVQAWRATPAGARLVEMCEHYIGIYEQNNPQMGGCALHDPLAVAAALDPTFVGCLPANLRVDLSGPGRGRTVCDPDRLLDAEKTCDVALTVDAARFHEEFLARVSSVL